MRRLAGVLLFVAAVPVSASLVPWMRPDSGCCVMVCHAGEESGSSACCLLGATPDRPVLQSCSGSVDGVPPAPGCALLAPRTSVSVSSPPLAGLFEPASPAIPTTRSLEIPDPVPLGVS